MQTKGWETQGQNGTTFYKIYSHLCEDSGHFGAFVAKALNYQTSQPPQNAKVVRRTTVTIRCLETGQDYVIPIAANTVSRPTVAVMLVLDKSASMLDDAGDGRTRIDVLRESAGVFVDVIQEDNGIGVVRFATDAEPGFWLPLCSLYVFTVRKASIYEAITSVTSLAETPSPSSRSSSSRSVRACARRA